MLGFGGSCVETLYCSRLKMHHSKALNQLLSAGFSYSFGLVF